jgi:hypothetical protein
MWGNWMLWTSLVLVGLAVVGYILEPPLPGFIMFLTSLALPIAGFLGVAWYFGRRRQEGKAPPPRGPGRI